MSQHYRTICKECGTIINQCRCMSENKKTFYDICEKCKINESEDEQPEVEGVDTGIEGVKADDLYNDTPVFDVSQEEFYKNLRQERNKLRFKNGSAVSQFMQQSKYRKPFYIRAKDVKGEKILKKFK